jgi:uncharacterized glyoxalase superfamily protein PhnB
MDVYPALTYRDVEAALALLSEAFGMTISDVGRDEFGGIRAASAASAVSGIGRVLVQPDLPAELHGTHLGHGWVYVAVADPDAHFERARAAGARVLGEPHDAFDGAMGGYSARDLEGNLWSFGTDRPGG